jgi:CRISPR-associated protein Csm5
MAKQTYTLSIKPLTGIHIGTGEELTPLDYKLVKSSFPTASGTGVKVLYWKYSSNKILSRFIADAEQKELTAFERAGVNGSMGELQSFFQKHCTVDDIEYLCDVTNEFEQLYKHNRAKDPLDNAARVLQMYRPEGSKGPVIPGSSLKGSIRTALLNQRLDDLDDAAYHDIDREVKDTRKVMDDTKVQKKLLHYDDAKNDPFRCVLIRDAAFKAKDTQLVGLLKNISCDKSGESLSALDKLQIQAEAIRGELLEGTACAETTIALDRDLQGASGITQITMQELVTACNLFYWDEFQKEYKQFYQHVLDGSTDIIEQLRKKLEAAAQEKNQFMLRLGRWSQVEFVTLATRKPDTRRNGKDMGWGKTRTVFSYKGQFVPMGWCIMTIKEGL